MIDPTILAVLPLMKTGPRWPACFLVRRGNCDSRALFRRRGRPCGKPVCAGSLVTATSIAGADLMSGLRESAGTISEGRRQSRMHAAMVVVQTALAMICWADPDCSLGQPLEAEPGGPRVRTGPCSHLSREPAARDIRRSTGRRSSAD